MSNTFAVPLQNTRVSSYNQGQGFMPFSPADQVSRTSQSLPMSTMAKPLLPIRSYPPTTSSPLEWPVNFGSSTPEKMSKNEELPWNLAPSLFDLT